MTKAELLELIQNGESLTVEFKKSTNEITKDVYDTVCAFSNREGGHIFLGIRDDGTIEGVALDAVERMKKDFVTAVNNINKLYPPIYLSPEEIPVEGRIILHIYVPIGTQVCRHNGKIFDRSHEADLDITNNSDAVYRLYARKQDSYYVNKITGFEMSDLRADLIDRARKMSRIRNMNHPWLTMDDEEILRSAGLILKDDEKRREGITLAGILLFGKDVTIMSALPQHKTDAIFRVENVDRYDDRDVIITNLFDTYDRLMEFGKKHLSDPFVLEGINSVSARDKILREIFSNFLAHRDYSSAYVAKFVIEKQCMYTENANRVHGYGMLELSNFEPFSKNPTISKVFREISLADELGSGMRNTYKYTKLYSGGRPEFIEGNIFKTMIPLTAVSVGKVGPSQVNLVSDQDKASDQVSDQDRVSDQVSDQDNAKMSDQDRASDQVSDQDNVKKSDQDRFSDQVNDPGCEYGAGKKSDIFQRILDFCIVERSKKEICEYMGYKNRTFFTRKYLAPLILCQKLQMTQSDKPNSRNQRYITVR